MILRAVIIAGEQASIEALENDLREYCPNVDNLKTCETVPEGLEAIRQYKPNLVFLDIKLSRYQKGFELLQYIKEFQFAVIIVSAHPGYALEAFDDAAMDLLQKATYDGEHLQKVIQQASIKNRTLLFSSHPDKISEPPKQSTKVCLRSSEKIDFIPIQNIIYCEAFGGITKFIIEGLGQRSISKALGKVTDWLAPHLFIRIHDSYLVNFQHIKAYNRRDNALLLSNQTILSISKSRKAGFLDAIREFSI